MKNQLLLYTFYFMIFILIMMILMMDGSFIQRVQFYVKTGDANNEIHSLLDFEPQRDKPVSDKNIFFIETSSIAKKDLVLNARQGCSVESAAKMNPNMTVYLLLVCCSKVSSQSMELFDQLENYPNVRIRRVYLDQYMKDTPLEKWYEKGAWKKSQWPTSYMSDVLRYLTLWKYGGIYLDLDVVVTKSLEDLKSFAGIQDAKTINSAAIGFDSSSLGRFMAELCIHDLRINFRGDTWIQNGPGVITRTLKKFCATDNIKDMSTKRCHGFEIFPPSVFYPIDYSEWKVYFQNENKERTMELVKKARVIHLWNKLSVGENVRVDSDVPYTVLARKHCPRIFSNSGTVF